MQFSSVLSDNISHLHSLLDVETNFDARAKVRRSIGGVSAKRVAQAGIEGMLRGKVVVLPGALMKMTYVGEKLLPESWMLKIAYRAQARKG